MNRLKTLTALILSIGFLTACSSNETQTGGKTKTDLYLLNRMQETSINYYRISDSKYWELKEAAEYEPDQSKKKKIGQLILAASQFDSKLEKLTDKIETTKLEIVKQLGLDLKARGVTPYENNRLDSRYPLISVDPNKSISTSFDFKQIGKDLVALRSEFRNDVLSVLLNNTLRTDNKSFTFNDPKIRYENSNVESFISTVEQSFSKMKINYDDAEISKTIYMQISPNEAFFTEAFKDGLSWIDQMALLEDQRQQLLDIRSTFMSLLCSKTSLAKTVDFNSIIAVTEGNEAVKGGSEQTFKIFIAGVNTFQQPIVTVNGGISAIEIEDGVAKVKVKVPNAASEVMYAGTISTLDKNGNIIIRPWTKKFVISK